MSPNDIQIIFADADPESDYGYTVTGQKHNGIIWAIESLVENLCPALWLERGSAEDRARFMAEVIREGRVSVLFLGQVIKQFDLNEWLTNAILCDLCSS